MPEEADVVAPKEGVIPAEITTAFASSLTKPDDVLGQKTSGSFQNQPFFPDQNTEPTEEEKKAAADKADADRLEAERIAAGVVDPLKPGDDDKDTEIHETEFVGLLNEAIGDPDVSFTDISQIKALIEETKKYRAIKEQLQELSLEERARIETGRKHGDASLYDKITGIDLTKITPKEALRQAYFIDNIGNKNTLFLDKSFEKMYAATYAEDEEDPEYSKLLLENNGQKAIQTIEKWQKDLKALSVVSGTVDPQEAKKIKDAEDQKWFDSVDSVITKRDRIAHEIDGGFKINVVMDAKDKQAIANAMDAPLPFLKSLVTDAKGDVSFDKLFDVVMGLKYQKQTLVEAFKAGQAAKHEEILKEKKGAPEKKPDAGNVSAPSNIADAMVKHLQEK